MKPLPIRGRGASHNPANRFERIEIVRDGWTDPGDPAPRTEFLRDTSRSIIARNESPDFGFETSINPYRGCEHGCIYCYARPYHEYLGFSAGLDFETRILVKPEAPELLRAKLASPRWEPQTLIVCGVTDPYQPIERRVRLTRRCLEVLAEFRNPVSVTTKNHLVTRDLDVLGELARYRAASVTLSITTLDDRLQRVMEPRTSSPARRLDAVARLAEAGIPVSVNVAPVIPGLTDHELPRILEAAAAAGACSAAYLMLRLPHGVASLFEAWLAQHFPDRKEKVLNRIQAIRGGNLNDPRFGTRLCGEGIFAEGIADLFEVACRKFGLDETRAALSAAAFRRPAGRTQLRLFD
ncbi:MAG: radical SAM protein [Gemmatimonas sp. SM23_52]|nr:MAG: radical SAM protein [Gemmatimonas sp. SM23_52]